MKQLLLGLLFMGIGGALMYYSYPLMEMFGRNAWAERNLGGTRNLILLVGFLLMLVGGLVMFGIVSLTSTGDIPSGLGTDVS
ncbi:MAG: hypothetical protein LBP53_00570 [Candidatus Peribacteria bacterium]|jgi:hypothetical protein|nr:hypothetical protein [Candidatus Peribacteria bacterium]